jgi:SAM-dependent methyltransferase
MLRVHRDGEAFDARFHENPRSVRRFHRIETPLRAAATRAHALLDLGCGTGRLLADLPAAGSLRIGIDLSAPLLQQALARRLTVLRADAHTLPFGDGAFDTIIAANAVFRYLRVRDAMSECHRVLRPGGRLALHQYAARTLSLRSGRRPFNPSHLHSLDDIRTPAAAAGFTQESLHLWRGIRLFPYAIRLPERLAAPLHLWDHAIFILRRR